jgi:hypothetical protein
MLQRNHVKLWFSLLWLVCAVHLGRAHATAAAAAAAVEPAACWAAPSAERAQCICSQTLLGRDRYISDVGRDCRGAVRCLATAKYRACSIGRKFDESAQRCVPAAAVNCQQAALAKLVAASTCSGGPTPDGTCGAGRPGNYNCKAGQCCSLYGICGWTPSHCDVNNGCQVRLLDHVRIMSDAALLVDSPASCQVPHLPHCTAAINRSSVVH